MEIIQDNRWRPNKKCDGCSSLLRLDAEDVHYDQFTNWRAYGFICVVFGYQNRLREDDLPSYVKYHAASPYPTQAG